MSNDPLFFQCPNVQGSRCMTLILYLSVIELFANIIVYVYPFDSLTKDYYMCDAMAVSDLNLFYTNIAYVRLLK